MSLAPLVCSGIFLGCSSVLAQSPEVEKPSEPLAETTVEAEPASQDTGPIKSVDIPLVATGDDLTFTDTSMVSCGKLDRRTPVYFDKYHEGEFDCEVALAIVEEYFDRLKVEWDGTARWITDEGANWDCFLDIPHSEGNYICEVGTIATIYIPVVGRSWCGEFVDEWQITFESRRHDGCDTAEATGLDYLAWFSENATPNTSSFEWDSGEWHCYRPEKEYATDEDVIYECRNNQNEFINIGHDLWSRVDEY